MNKNIKLAYMFLCGILIFMFTGCGLETDQEFKRTDSQDVAERIMKAADEEDKEALYELMADSLSDINSDLDEEIEAFLGEIDGELVSCEKEGEEEYTTSDTNLNYKTEISSTYIVETTSGKYVINFVDYIEVNDEKYKGIQSLGVQSYEDYQKDPCFAATYGGVYVVTPENHEYIKALRK